MQQTIQFRATIPPSGNSINRSPLRLGFLLIPLALVCFGLAPMAQAVDPPPDGGYANGNTAEGDDALFSLTTGGFNTAMGRNALYSLTTGDFNTAIGDDALYSNTEGTRNTAIGYAALNSNTTGESNTATGIGALRSNTSGRWNTATGVGALQSNTEGQNNTATGIGALLNNTTGQNNTATGQSALFSNAEGNQNTATGAGALYNNTGDQNIAIGLIAGFNLTTGNNNIDIGNQGIAAEANTIRIGDPANQTATFIAGINGVDKSSGSPVFIDADGQLGTGTTAGSTGPTGSVVMLPAVGGVAPPAPAGYVFQGFVLLTSRAKGGQATSYAVYTKS